MPDISTVKQTIYDHFATELAASAFSSVPWTRANEAFTPPEGDWMRVTLVPLSSQQDTLGKAPDRKWLRRGTVITQIFTPANKGTSQADGLTQFVREVFEGRTISGLRFRAANPVPVPAGEDARWYQVNVDQAFDYHERR